MRHVVEPVQILDAPVPQMGDQVLELLQKIVSSLVEPVQVLAVPKLSFHLVPQRSVARSPQTAEQLVEVPTERGYVFAIVEGSTGTGRSARGHQFLTVGGEVVRALLLAAMIIAVFEGYVSETWSESTLLLVVFELVLPYLAGTGSTCEGVKNAQVLALSEQVSSCQSGSDPVSGPGAETELPGHEMDFACREIVESDVLDGAFSTPVDSDVVGSSGSCIKAFVPFGCSSSTGFWGKDENGKEKQKM